MGQDITIRLSRPSIATFDVRHQASAFGSLSILVGRSAIHDAGQHGASPHLPFYPSTLRPSLSLLSSVPSGCHDHPTSDIPDLR